MDYNATTPLEPEVIQAVTEAMKEAWGNPSSSYVSGNLEESMTIKGTRSLLEKVYTNKTWWHVPLIPALRGRLLSEFKASLVYKVSSWTARAT